MFCLERESKLMRARTHGENLLYELAQTLAAGNDHSTAIALRKLVQAGYTTLQQVDGVSDWALLALPGLGVKRLGAVRRLTRPDWQPPSRHAIQAANWYLSAAQFALRYWPPDTLASFIRGSAPAVATQGPVEKRLALDVFSQATNKALSYCPPQELVEMLRLARNGHHPGRAHQDPELHHDSRVQVELIPDEQQRESGPETSRTEPGRDDAAAESDRYAYSPRKRREIVQHYRAVRDSGLIENKDRWAHSNYNITGRTLLNYEREFPEEEQRLR